jgi:teichuronic acid exporter
VNESDQEPPGVPPAADRADSPRTALLWSYALTIGRFVTTGVVTVVMASYLDPRAYGVMALAMVWVVFAQSLALHGPAQAIVQRHEVTDQHLDAAFWSTLSGSGLLALLFAVAAPFWAAANDASDLIHVCWALAPAILLNALVVVPDAILRRNMAFKKLSLRVLIAGILSGGLGVAAAVAGYGVWALVIQQMTLTTFSAAAVWVAVPWRPRFSKMRTPLRDMRSYSLHSLSGFLANFIANRTDALILGVVLGPVAIGLYRFAIRITDMVNDVAVGGLGQISLPHLARISSARREFAERTGRVIHMCALLSLPIFGILVPAAPWLLGWIGPQWVDAVPAMRVLCVGGAFGAIGTTLAVALQAAGRVGVVAATGWAFAGATALAMWRIGVHFQDASARTQILAIAVTYCTIHAVIFAVGAFVLCRSVLKVSMGVVFRPVIPAAAAAVVAVLAGLAVQPLLTGIALFVGLVLTGLVASTAAGLVLLFADPFVSAYARRLLARGRTPGRARPRQPQATFTDAG